MWVTLLVFLHVLHGSLISSTPIVDCPKGYILLDTILFADAPLPIVAVSECNVTVANMVIARSKSIDPLFRIRNSYLSISGSSFSNFSSLLISAINSTITISNTIFDRGLAPVVALVSPEITFISFSHSIISNTRAASPLVQVYLPLGTPSFYNTSLINNDASSGPLMAFNASLVSFSHGQFAGNSAFFCSCLNNSGDILISNSVIQGNVASRMLVLASGSIRLVGVEIKNNFVDPFGAFVAFVDLTVINSSCIAMRNSSLLDPSNSNFIASCFVCMYGSTLMDNCTFRDNIGTVLNTISSQLPTRVLGSSFYNNQGSHRLEFD